MSIGTISGTISLLLREELEGGKSMAYLIWPLGFPRHRIGGGLVKSTLEESHNAGELLLKFPTLQNTLMEIK